jgi:chemotaxis response regulator CheB
LASFWGALQAATGMAYIVVQHLDPRHESLLPEILAKKTTIPVTAAVGGEVVQPDHVYVIPPNVTLTVVDGRIELHPRPSAPNGLARSMTSSSHSLTPVGTMRLPWCSLAATRMARPASRR